MSTFTRMPHERELKLELNTLDGSAPLIQTVVILLRALYFRKEIYVYSDFLYFLSIS